MKKDKKAKLAAIIFSILFITLTAGNLIILDNLNSRIHDLEMKTNNMDAIYNHLNSLSDQIDNLETK